MSYVSPENSKLLYATKPLVAADGVTAAIIKVRLRDHNNLPVPGRLVVLQANSPDAVITQPPATDENGAALGYVRSATPGPVIISAQVPPEV